ncbi:hypothetical protein NE237_028994 [Protea cynaroides]|uniref:Uncharacterized protein n=1 Tax=Protea cynaroides TaxID=273540 RepID=A0A9Q0GQE2_9MAGN|nr:hypothetical protein NE237_028994 [Protea cynaroides]
MLNNSGQMIHKGGANAIVLDVTIFRSSSEMGSGHLTLKSHLNVLMDFARLNGLMGKQCEMIKRQEGKVMEGAVVSDVKLIGVAAAGFGLDSGKHAATLTKGELSRIISARLDYPGVGPEHSFLKYIGRADYYSTTDEEALEGNSLQLSSH